VNRGSLPQSTTDALARILAADPRVNLALVFGSRARGTAREDSDLDLAVLGGADLDRLRLAAELSLASGLDTAVIDLRAVPIPLLAAIIRDGVVVFERQSGLFASWRTQRLLDLELDLPWFRRMRDAWLTQVREQRI
jgi:predicted nucleotidyltransferase